MRRIRNDAREGATPPVLNMLLMTQNIGAADPFDGAKGGDKTVVPANVRDLLRRWQVSCAEVIAAEEERMGGAPVDVFVLHVQEIGGKGYSTAMIELLHATHRNCYPGAAWSSGLLMSQADDVATFTALGSFIYLSARALACASMLDFRKRSYVRLADVDAFRTPSATDDGACSTATAAAPSSSSASSPAAPPTPSEAVNAGMRDAFYPAKFCNAETSRKGFLLTSLRFGRRTINLINMHLFHDADNSVAGSCSPSPYVARRVDSFMESLLETACAVDETDPLFIFGDLNLRLDACEVIASLAEKGMAFKLNKKAVGGDAAAWEYVTDPARWAWLRQFDKEPPLLFQRAWAECQQRLHEAPVRFGPTYLVGEDEVRVAAHSAAARTSDGGAASAAVDDEEQPAHRAVYKNQRVPAWCDRVFFNTAAAERFVASARPKDLVTPGVPRYGSAPLVHLDHLSVCLFVHFNATM